MCSSSSSASPSATSERSPQEQGRHLPNCPWALCSDKLGPDEFAVVREEAVGAKEAVEAVEPGLKRPADVAAVEEEPAAKALRLD